MCKCVTKTCPIKTIKISLITSTVKLIVMRKDKMFNVTRTMSIAIQCKTNNADKWACVASPGIASPNGACVYKCIYIYIYTQYKTYNQKLWSWRIEKDLQDKYMKALNFLSLKIVFPWNA